MAFPLQGSAQLQVDDAAAGGQFSLAGPHGHATWQAIGALVIIAFIVGRGRSLLGALATALAFIGLVFLANIVYGHLAHSWVATHPESPFAVGLEFNMSGV